MEYIQNRAPRITGKAHKWFVNYRANKQLYQYKIIEDALEENILNVFSIEDFKEWLKGADFSDSNLIYTQIRKDIYDKYKELRSNYDDITLGSLVSYSLDKKYDLEEFDVIDDKSNEEIIETTIYISNPILEELKDYCELNKVSFQSRLRQAITIMNKNYKEEDIMKYIKEKGYTEYNKGVGGVMHSIRINKKIWEWVLSISKQLEISASKIVEYSIYKAYDIGI